VPATGRPILILPYAGNITTSGKRILVAWNASREAARAISDALPLLKLAEKVNLIRIHPKHGEHPAVPADQLTRYLARQAVKVEVMTEHVADIDVGNELLSRAADLGSDLIVMGGYGHSRLREWVMGGATRTILESMTVPVLMSH
jgi:nucleotide-binding universal stress UspA family protein